MTVNTHTAIEKSITDYSQKVQEPTWMLQRRLNASAKVETLALPHVEKTKIDNWNFTNFTPFASAQSISAENLPAALAELISENDENLYVQINSDEIVHRFSDKLKNQGVIFTSLQTALAVIHILSHAVSCSPRQPMTATLHCILFQTPPFPWLMCQTW